MKNGKFTPKPSLQNFLTDNHSFVKFGAFSYRAFIFVLEFLYL